MELHTIGIDLGKTVFHLVGTIVTALVSSRHSIISLPLASITAIEMVA